MHGMTQQGWQHLSRRTQISEYHHFLDHSTTIHYVLEPLGYLQAFAYVQASQESFCIFGRELSSYIPPQLPAYTL